MSSCTLGPGMCRWLATVFCRQCCHSQADRAVVDPAEGGLLDWSLCPASLCPLRQLPARQCQQSRSGECSRKTRNTGVLDSNDFLISHIQVTGHRSGVCYCPMQLRPRPPVARWKAAHAVLCLLSLRGQPCDVCHVPAFQQMLQDAEVVLHNTNPVMWAPDQDQAE